MKKRVLKLSLCCLASGMLCIGAGICSAAAEVGQEQGSAVSTDTAALTDTAAPENTEAQTEQDLTGQMAFAKCEDYINIRSGADTDKEIVAKIYNNGSVTVLEQTGDWYKIQSGNAVGYVKAEYFAIGQEAEEIARKVAYNVAVVHPDELNIRMNPSEDTEVIDVAHHQEELEVVAYDGDWMKVALGNDVYGYVNAYYVDYKTYYPQAETLEEEQARLAAEQQWQEHNTAAEETWEASNETQSTETGSETEVLPEEIWTEPETTWTEPETTWTEPETTWTEPETTWTEPETTWTEPETTWTEPETTWTEPETTWTEPETTWTEPETTWTEPETTWTEPETTWTEPETTWTEPETTWTEPETEAPTSGTGQQIADFAVQYVGYPYVWGGTSLTQGADCSGFAQSVFAQFGIGLARVAADQAYGGTDVSMDSILPGDLLFYSSGGSIDHVAIYIGEGSIVHAANASSGIIISSYNYSTPVCARRYW
ncbi:MAG: C40 family peptidase [Lachnospiraceae bacterium]|nr:C40 family peptidase [Lachnospiraceae bacterium]